MTSLFVKVTVSLCVVTAIVGGQSLRGQSRRFGGVVGNGDTPTQLQMSRQQQLSSRNRGLPFWDREDPAPRQFDQFSLQSPSRFSMAPRTVRLPRRLTAQSPRDMQPFQQQFDQRQQLQTMQGSQQQQRQQKLRQLQMNRIMQRQSQRNTRFITGNGLSRQNRRTPINANIGSSRIPLLGQQQRQRQQALLARDGTRFGFEENSLLPSLWNEELAQGILQPSPRPFSERTQISNPNQQQIIWEQRRINNLLRRQKNEKQRAEQVKLQERQQEEKMHRLLLQEQQPRQHWQIQQPTEPNGNGITNTVSLNPPETVPHQAETNQAQLVNSSPTGQAQVKQERIYQLASLLGFKPSDLVKVVAELEASKYYLGTSTLTDPAANRLINQITPNVLANKTVLNIGDVNPTFDSGVAKVMGDNMVKAHQFREEITQYPPIIYKVETTNYATSTPVTTSTTQALTNAITSQTAEAFPVMAPAVTYSPFTNRLLNQNTPDVLANKTVLTTRDVIPTFDSGVAKVMGDNIVKTHQFREEITQYPPIIDKVETTNYATSTPVTTSTTQALTNAITSQTAEAFIVMVPAVTYGPFTSTARSTTTSARTTTTTTSTRTTTASSATPESSTTAGNNSTSSGTSSSVYSPRTQISDINSAPDVQYLLHSLLGPMASQSFTKDNGLSAATNQLLMQIHNLINNSNKTELIGSNSSNNVAILQNSSAQFVNSTRNAQVETGSNNNILTNDTTLATFVMMGADAWNLTGNMTDWNVTMTPPIATTMEVNVTTTVVTEATEAVPTPPPPEPGFPHMYEALPGQELTEAQLEYNEMREALMK